MMKNFIKMIKILISDNKANQESKECNYSDNYYGDQICQ